MLQDHAFLQLSRDMLIPSHSSFSTPEFYTSTSSYLKDAGYETETIALPSAGGAIPKTMHDDVAHIQSVASKYCDQGKDVVIAMHSYGGIPGTESSKGMSKADREAAGKKGGIVGLVYIAARCCALLARPSWVSWATASRNSFLSRYIYLYVLSRLRKKF